MENDLTRFQPLDDQQIFLSCFVGDDGKPVIQIDSTVDFRVNVNDAPIWDFDPEGGAFDLILDAARCYLAGESGGSSPVRTTARNVTDLDDLAAALTKFAN